MSETPHTTIRLPKATKKKLLELAQIDDTSMSQVINDLIVAEYRQRREEIAEFRKSLKNSVNVRFKEIDRK
jgi:predicted transcriptional regulator